MEKLDSFREIEEMLRAEPREMPRGVVRRFDRARGFGFVEGVRGQRVFFYVATLDFLGELGEESLGIGADVGYDVTLTTKGPRASRIKIRKPAAVPAYGRTSSSSSSSPSSDPEPRRSST